MSDFTDSVGKPIEDAFRNIGYDLNRILLEPKEETIEKWRSIRTKLKGVLENSPEAAILTSGSSSLIVPILMGKSIDLETYIGAQAKFIIVGKRILLMLLGSRLSYALYKDALSIPDYEQGEDFHEIKILLEKFYGPADELLVIDDHINGGRKARTIKSQLLSTGNYKKFKYVGLTSMYEISTDSVETLCVDEKFTDYVISLGKLVKYSIDKDTPAEKRKHVISLISQQIKILNQDITS